MRKREKGTAAHRAGKRALFAFAAISLLSACGPPPVVKQLDEQPYFDLKGYLDAQRPRLEALDSLEKTVRYEGKSETLNIAPDWEAELKEWYAADLNRPAWLGRYAVSSSGDTTKYVAQDDKLEVRQMLVWRKGGQVAGIRIRKEKPGLMNASRREMYFSPEKGMGLRSIREAMALGKDTLHIDLGWEF